MKRIVNSSLAAIILLFTLTTWVQAQEVKSLTPEFVESLKSVTSVAVSPDGNWIAFGLNVPRGLEEESGRSYAELYLIPFTGGEARGYVTGKGRAFSPSFSPDGKQLAFLTNRGEHTQVYALPVDGGEARQLTKSPTGVSSFLWSADGRKIAYRATDDYSEEEKKKRDAGEDMILVEQKYRFTRIHVLDIESGEDKTITPAEYNVWSFDWSPDGARFVITASDIATTDASYMLKKLYLVDAGDGSRKLLCETAGKLSGPLWSPGGDKVTWHGGVDMFDASTGTLYVCSVSDGKAVNLTPDFDGTVTDCHWLDNDTLAFTAIERQHTYLYTVGADGGNMKKIAGGGAVFGSASFSVDGSKFALSASTPTHPGELFAGTLAGGEMKKLTDHNPALADIELGRQVIVKWKAQDGTELEGILIYPVGYKEGVKYPLIVQPHGGPEGAYLDGWNTSYSRWTQMLAVQGYFVFAPNYRGSIGRGVAFAKADHKDLGGKEFQDVIDGIDHLVEIGLVDRDRVGSGGGSYGGYFSALAATKASDRFAAAVVFAGITNWYSFQGTSDIPIENAYVHWAVPNWHENPEMMWKASPVAYIKNANTPTLIAHGQNDLRVPLNQGEELYRNLVFKGTPVEFVVYPREPHGLLESRHRLDYAKRVLEWFDKYVKNRKIEKENLD